MSLERLLQPFTTDRIKSLVRLKELTIIAAIEPFFSRDTRRTDGVSSEYQVAATATQSPDSTEIGLFTDCKKRPVSY